MRCCLPGDLFDNEWLTLATERVLVDELTRATSAGLTVVYATGNHDPGRANYRAMGIELAGGAASIWSRRASREVDCRRARGRRGGMGRRGGASDAARGPRSGCGIPARRPGPEPAVALLHAQVMSAVSGRAARSLRPDHAGRPGPQLCLLGAGPHSPAPRGAARSTGPLSRQRAGPAPCGGRRQGSIGGDAGCRGGAGG